MIQKIFSNLPKIIHQNDRKKIISILFLMVLLGLFEVIGVAAVGPFTALLMDRELYQVNKIFITLNSYINAETYNSFFIVYAIISFLLMFYQFCLILF